MNYKYLIFILYTDKLLIYINKLIKGVEVLNNRDEGAVVQNLKDAGCDENTIADFMQKLRQGKGRCLRVNFSKSTIQYLMMASHR
jgi:hypothetical protein